MKKVDILRKKYPRFIYEGYSWKISKNELEIFFDFVIRSSDISKQRRISSDIIFCPKITIKNIHKSRIKRAGDKKLNNLIFHLGLMEIPSYWKATCSPEIIIKAGCLNSEQIKWWKDLIIKGMGQFFYENRIDFIQPNFLKIISSNPEQNLQGSDPCKFRNRVLIPVGGGKDSIVTLEQLKKQKKKINCFLVNPTKAAKAVVKIAGIKNPVVVERKIDQKLLELNKKGYLNGHTPFTALLSFLAVFCGVLFDYKNIAFSNEKSANEGNLKYLGKTINHQWSKSSEFERKFKNYCKKYLVKNLPAGRQGINYFSYLRKYTELEISKIFIKYPQYFSVFSSCNTSQKTGERWCGNCPKCLFVYAALYPFLEEKELLKIFKKDVFQNKALLQTMKSLIGKGEEKPFECVGTFRESRLAFSLSLEKTKKTGKTPYLLTKI